MNIDRSAFDLRRELGIVVDDGPILKGLVKVFERDWDEAHHWDAPDPLAETHRRRRAAPRPALPA